MEAELLRRTGDLQQAADVLTGLRGPATPHTAHALARLHLAAGDAAAAEQSLAPFPPELGTVRQRVDGAILRTLIAAEPRPRVPPCSCWRTRCSRPPPSACAAPSWWRRPACGRCSTERIEAGTAVAAFAVDLLRRMSGQHDRPLPPAALVEALTEREQVVLRYLASTLSNAEIAAELYLSVNTVKTHQRMIYRKLGADGRRDAVRRAKQLRLL